MYAQQALPFGDYPVSAVSVSKANSGPAACMTRGFNEPGQSAPHFVRSVVEEAGLSRFVYLKGCSGRRYVFSMIKPEQAQLYERAVFASGGADGSAVKLTRATNRDVFSSNEGSAVYVHLLADEDSDGGDIIADLTSAIQ